MTLLLGTLSENDDLRERVLDYNQRMSGEWRPVSQSEVFPVPILIRL